MRTPDDIFAAMDALLPALHGLHQHRRAARQAFMHGYVRYSVVQDADASLGEMETWYRGMAAAVRAHPDWDGLIPMRTSTRRPA